MPLVKKWQLDEHKELPDTHHRKWAWADEQSWDRSIVLPVQGKPASDGTDPSGGWNKSPNNPVLDLGASGKFDDKAVTHPCAIRVGSAYRVYYAGHNVSANQLIGIGLATTTNPFSTLTRYSTDPIIDLGSGGSVDDTAVYCPSVIYDPALEKYICFYMARDGSGADFNIYLCRATSNDGLSWTKDSPPNVASFGSKLSGWKDYGSVIKVGKFYHCICWINDTGGLGLWSSLDGTSWDYYGEVLSVGSSGDWDDTWLNYASMFWNLGTWYLMYCAKKAADGLIRIGMATSSTGWSFTKWPKNPVFSVGSGGQWDDARVARPALLLFERTFYLWYSGHDGTRFKIGVAKMEL